MPLAQWFSDFCGNLVVSDTTTISTRYKAITRRLNTDFWDTTSETSHSLYVGSYGRNTAIEGFSDLDMIFELPAALFTQYDNYLGNGQSALLQSIRSSMQKTYPSTQIGGDGQVVAVSFSDGMRFEVVPVFDWGTSGYRYPDSNEGGSWSTTDPRAEQNAIMRRNVLCNFNLVPLCRMMRAWKNQWSVPIGGLLVDTLAYQFIDNWAHKGESYFYYDFLCRDFFKYMSEQSRTQNYWRAPGSSAYVLGGELFQHKAKQCYNLSLAAIEHETATPKREWSACNKWREIFGSEFPA